MPKALTRSLLGLMAAGAALVAMAIADPYEASSRTGTVDGIDYPYCSLEDCSDQPNQVGIWVDRDTGNQWLSTGETSYLIKR
ncbi:hypothetical protein PBI_MYXUS_90 [Mycobacterium phage Myxus]|uniref:Uncharacterized protein n=8 Tax=Fromanvirus TaxID=186764 RepID=A0A142K4Z6_9CAUD|nr:hypothetical protein BJD80_gp019 [Mycobacterium phage Catalina]YP_009636055.1 hypothetical protein FGG56_gp18 [Mycobacterium phage PackMan]AMO43958.1 hypothetical protein PBI_MYXUS_90 [Mycobacterium phage Myxus]AMS00888.1 hypothetical protein PBI_EIDSMOE_88 [Mycobacterium phage Eidsmoe]AOQ29047.1 hypothetical protein SEA_HORTUMSL17_91 [Mycobacterium phage HortumSL17]AOT26205.1 hypothetical protein SEA_QOBBIT_88 [Mycobacterium phage Qobbit]AOY12010.1 hypothetical protein SEA_PHAEDER_90 [Myc